MKSAIRVLFAFLIIFELLNWLEILHFPLDFSWLNLAVTALSVFLFVSFFNPPMHIWAAVFGGVLLDAFSDIFHLYSAFPFWDRLVHFGGGFISAVLIFYLVRRVEEKAGVMFPQFFVFIAVVSAVSLVGTLYEYWEFAIDENLGGAVKMLGDGADTVDDMILNILGAMIFILLAYSADYYDKRGARESVFTLTASESKS